MGLHASAHPGRSQYLSGMITRLLIENFKTVRSLDLPCKRFNLFIGDTNTGKTNVLEALTLLSQNIIAPTRESPHQHELDRRILRYGQLNDLFPGRDVTLPLRVSSSLMNVSGRYGEAGFTFEFTDHVNHQARYTFQAAGNPVGMPQEGGNLQSKLRRYHYDPAVRFGPHWYTHLAPPDGSNLGAILMANTDLAEEVSEILAAKEVTIEVNPETYGISLRHSRARNVVVPIAFQNLSETLRRYLFMYVAIRTNQGSVLLFDEPEQNTYPFYTAHIGEIMALDGSNQYFLTTHNPYVLSAFVDKAPADELQVLATYRKEGRTEVHVLSTSELHELMEFDAFLNIDRILNR